MSRRAAVIVEGDSDREFWNVILRREFPHVHFAIRNGRGRNRVESDACQFVESFRESRKDSILILLDQDTSPCFAAVAKPVVDNIGQLNVTPEGGRFVQICVANRSIESWWLADEDAIRAVLPKSKWTAPGDTSQFDESKLKELWRKQHGDNATLNKTDFAKRIAREFSVDRAMRKSPSLRIAWERVKRTVEQQAP